MYQAYAIRPTGDATLFNPGGLFDQNFALSNVAVRQFVADFYPTVAGPFQANYLGNSLISRGLVNCSYGPQLPNVPYAEDAGAIVQSLRKFAASFVKEYYISDDMISQDKELQAWVSETTTTAQVIDFPAAPLTVRETLIDILTRMAYLTGVNHHTLNSAIPAISSGVLPFHPMALYQPIPEEKGIQSVLPFLPNANASLSQVELLLAFIRPQLFDSQRDLVSIFEGSMFLGGASGAITQTADTLRSRLSAISDGIQGRKSDENGLAQGMPFVWRNLDPRKLPFFLSV